MHFFTKNTKLYLRDSQQIINLFGSRLNCSGSVHAAQQSFLLKIRNCRISQRPVIDESILYRRPVIVNPAIKIRSAADVTNPVNLRLLEFIVIACSAGHAGIAPENTLHDNFVWNLNFNYRIRRIREHGSSSARCILWRSLSMLFKLRTQPKSRRKYYDR